MSMLRPRLRTALVWAMLGLGAPQSPALCSPCEETEPAAEPTGKAGDEPVDKPGKLSGYMFGDVYWVAQHHDPAIDAQNGAWFRRVYLTYDRELGTRWAARLRLEANGSSFGASERMTPYVKDAWLRWTRGAHGFQFGLSPTPTWETIEDLWGYRFVEKTPLDLHRWSDSRDTGLSAKGSFDEARKFGYHAMVGNGTGTRGETDRDKRFYLTLSARPAKGLTLEAYGDWEDKPASTDQRTWQLFGNYQKPKWRIGGLFAQQTRRQGAGDADLKLEVLSGYAARQVASKLWVFGRVDRMFDPDPSGSSIAYLPFDPTAKSKLFLAGLDFQPIPAVRLGPNVEVITYDAVNGASPTTDVIARVTVYFSY